MMSFINTSLFPKKVSLSERIQTHQRKLAKEISISRKYLSFQVEMDENYNVWKTQEANFALYGRGRQFGELRLKCEKIRFLNEVSKLLTSNQLTGSKLNELLKKFPDVEDGIFSETKAIIKLIQKEMDGDINLDSLNNIKRTR